MPEYRSIIPVLRVLDLQRSIDFYCGLLGMCEIWRAPNEGEGENAMLHSGKISILLSTGSHLGHEPSFTGTLYFDIVGVHDFYQQIKEKVEIVWPLEMMEYGQQEFGIRDLDGYTLAFAQSTGGA